VAYYVVNVEGSTFKKGKQRMYQVEILEAAAATEQLFSSTKTLVRRLNLLDNAQRAFDLRRVREIERSIKAMARPGFWEGYPDDGSKPVVCKVLSMRRTGKRVDLHAFEVEYQKFGDDGKILPETHLVDLVEFISPTYRCWGNGNPEASYYGKRFWRLHT
jgi:hypothetical protein